MKQSFFLILAFLCLNFSLFAQENTSRFLGAQINLHTELPVNQYKFSTNSTISAYNHQSDAVLLGVSFQTINTNNWFQEFSINGIQVERQASVRVNPNEPEFGQRIVDVFLLMRWEYGKLFALFGTEKYHFGLSVGADPFVGYFENIPRIGTNFPFSAWKIGTQFSATPRFNYAMNDRLLFTTKLPISFFETRFEQKRLGNPLLSAEESRQNYTEFAFLIQGFELNFGLSYRL
ncbi:MAG: hypothetical protein AAGG68_13310 [Bacteroidota bacterium]